MHKDCNVSTAMREKVWMGLEEIELRHRWLTLEVYKWREKKARIADGVNRTKQIVLGMRSGSAR